MPLLHYSGKSLIKVLNKQYSYDKDAIAKYLELPLSRTTLESDFFNSVLFDCTFNHRNEQIAPDHQFRFRKIQRFPKSGVKVSRNILEQQPSPEQVVVWLLLTIDRLLDQELNTFQKVFGISGKFPDIQSLNESVGKFSQ